MQSASMPAVVDDEYYAMINPEQCSPMLDGLFLSWDNARKVIIRDNSHETQWNLRLLKANEERDVEAAKRVSAEKKEAAMTGGVEKFLATWGLPVGLVVGLIGGLVAGVSAGGVRK